MRSLLAWPVGLCTRSRARADRSTRRHGASHCEGSGPARDRVSSIIAVVAHEDGDLELDVHAETMEEVASQHGPRVDVEDLAHAVFGVEVEELVEPLQRVVVGLADPAEIAGDRGRAAE